MAGFLKKSQSVKLDYCAFIYRVDSHNFIWESSKSCNEEQDKMSWTDPNLGQLGPKLLQGSEKMQFRPTRL